MLEKIQRQNRIVEVNARNTMTGKVDDVADWPSSEGKEMGVDIGDTIHNYYSMPSAQQSPPPLPPSQPKSRLPSILKGAAVATALMVGTGGGAAAVAIPWLLGMFDKSEPPPAVSTDYSDGYMEVEKWEPEVGGGE